MDKTHPPDKELNYYKCVKLPLKHVLKDYADNWEKINNAVIMCDKIVTNTLLFMKLYLLDQFEKTKTIPVIDDFFAYSCLKTMCIKNTQKGKPPNKETVELMFKLKSFYEQEFKPYITYEALTYTNLDTTLKYLSTGIVTIYENNIKMHYVVILMIIIMFST